MKTFLALLVLVSSSVSLAGYTPDVEVSVGNDKSVHVQITNDSGADLNCKYSVSWFVNRINFRSEFGEISMSVGSITQLAYMNDPYAHLSKINTLVECL